MLMGIVVAAAVIYLGTLFVFGYRVRDLKAAEVE